MTETVIQSHLLVALHAAWAAGREIMDVYQGRVDVQYKDDRSPLTEADLRAHRAITALLQSRTPDIPILSEEAAAIPYDVRRHWTTCWLVDPLDGTKEFIKHNDEFTVNIAYVEAGQPQGGVVYAPALGYAYVGGANTGAYRLALDGTAEPPQAWDALLSLAQALPLENGDRPFTVVASRSHLSPETAAFIEALREEHPRLDSISAGSALKLCLVAEGSADVYPRFAPTMEWDTAAGHAVCLACDIPVVVHPGGQPLSYNKENLLNPWFLIDARGRRG